MENTKHLIIENKNGIVTIKINKPQVLNALDCELLDELDLVTTNLSQNPEIRVAIFTGEGRAFIAGADIKQMSQFNEAEGFEYGKKGAGVFRRIELLPFPVIAAINGFALGGGLELAMACDIRLASENAKLGQPEVGLGITPGFSGTQRLIRIIGIGLAKELIYTGKAITAQQALNLGLVNAVCPSEQLMDEALSMAESIAKNAPLAIRYAKEAISKGADLEMDSAILLENTLFAKCFTTQDQKEGTKAFVEKRRAEWKNE